MTSPVGDTSPNGVFYAISMTVSAAGGAVSIKDDLGTGNAPTGCLSVAEGFLLTQRTFSLSDVDYVAEGGQSGTTAYLPLVSQAIDVNRTLALSPLQGAAQITWGSIVLSNATGAWSSIYATGNVALLPIAVVAGMRSFDPVRGISIDPPPTDLVPAFAGVGTDWTLADDELSIPLDDATRYLARPIASQVAYTGGGGYGGASGLAGRYAPTCRGGTSSAPIRNVTPVQIDTVNWVFQFNTAPGTVAQLYVGGNASAFPRATSVGNNGDVADVYAVSVPQGQYVTCNARGIIRLGSAPVGQVTLDVTGAFPSGAAPSNAFALIKAFLAEDLLVPAAVIDGPWFDNIPNAYPNINPVIGWYWSDGGQLAGQDMMNTLLAGLNLRLITTRDGRLRLQPLCAAIFSDYRKGPLSEDQVSQLDAVTLPAEVATPTAQWQVGFQHNHTSQTATDLNAQASASYRTFVSAADRFAFATSSQVALAFAAPGAPAAIVTAMLQQSDASAIAAGHQAMWGTRRRSFLVTVGRKIALAYDIGDVFSLSWADAGIVSAPAIVVGEQFRSDEATTRIQVLI